MNRPCRINAATLSTILFTTFAVVGCGGSAHEPPTEQPGLATRQTTSAPATIPSTAPTTRPRFAPRGPQFSSPEVAPDRKVTFRLLAPDAKSVRLSIDPLPGDTRQPPRDLVKGGENVWSLTIGPVEPGTYRYTFTVDTVPVVDPRNQYVSESSGTTRSVLHVPGATFMDAAADVPHGAVAQVYYKSTALGGRTRRMTVYTPAGYEAGTAEKYPVFYLLHGAGDSDDSWTSVGRANFILDNLIAAGKAVPMIVVMPTGHTSPNTFTPAGGAPAPAPAPTTAATRPGERGLGNRGFEEDFTKDVRPYIEKHYRVRTDANGRAIAGLSMGGAQTLAISLANLKDYGYVGVFSSGLLFRPMADVEKELAPKLADAEAKKAVRLLWFATGGEDFLLNQSRQSVDLLKKLGLNPTFKQTTGGHTWINWQHYLNEFAPQLFQDPK